MKRKRLLYGITMMLSFMMIFCSIPVMANEGPVTVNDAAEHVFSGKTGPIVVEHADAKITLDGVEIDSGEAPAILVKAGADLTLTVKGENSLSAKKGYAAICVEPAYDEQYVYDANRSAVLRIKGDGVLNALGSDCTSSYGGGAGIGGNGQHKTDSPDVDFGTVSVDASFSGTINATGGAGSMNYDEYGGGAGIGSGGCNANWGEVFGSIIIENGNVNASSRSLGAGIGSGGSNSDNILSSLNIAIQGGTIHAHGGILGAGIGGGSMSEGGIISITGGDVQAKSGIADGSISAAGIGGGDNASVKSILIRNADVYAESLGGGAGIGGGANTSYGLHYGDEDGDRTPGHIGNITIEGRNTHVTAIGGTAQGYNKRIYAGSGIGSGYPVANNRRSVAFDIYLKDGADVRAFAGSHAQAIGYGCRPKNDTEIYTGYGIKVYIDDSVALYAQNKDFMQSALAAATEYDANPNTFVSENAYLLSYVSPESEIRQEGTVDGYKNLSKDPETFTWNLADGKDVLLQSETGESFTVESDYFKGNWAKTVKALFNVSYRWAEGVIPGDASLPSDETVKPGAAFTPADVKDTDQFRFAGWFTDEKGTISYDAQSAVTEDITLYGKWEEKNVYTVTYTDGVDNEEIFPDQVYTVYEGQNTPDFMGVIHRDGFSFNTWNPKVEQTVTGDCVYSATWKKIPVSDAEIDGENADIPQTGDSYIGIAALSLLILSAPAVYRIKKMLWTESRDS